MSASVLIDTSAWIQLLRDGTGPAADQVKKFLQLGLACIAGPIATELIRGARTKKELSALDDLFSVVGWLRIDEDTYLQAGQMGFVLSKKGVNLAAVDLILARVAIENQVPVLSLDKHFTQMAKHFPLDLV